MKKIAVNDKEIALLEAAGRLFARRGYSETSMRDIAQESGMAVGSIYLHYRNKESLLSALYRYGSSLLLARITTRLEGKKDALSRLAAYIQESILFSLETPDFFLILFVDFRRRELERPEPLVFSSFRHYVELGRQILREGTEKGLFSIPKHSDLILGIISFWVGVVLIKILKPSPEASPEETVQEIFAMIEASLIKGLLKPQNSRRKS